MSEWTEPGREDIGWQKRAVCRDEDPELFWPTGDETKSPAREQVEAAKAVCRRCPVLQQCLNFALENKEAGGVWGGLSEEDRKSLNKRQSSPTHRRAAS